MKPRHILSSAAPPAGIPEKVNFIRKVAKTFSLFLLFFLCSCGSEEYDISKAFCYRLPFDVESTRLFQIDDPVITLYYDVSEDPAVVNGGLSFVSDQKQPEISYPLLLDFPVPWIPFLSDLLDYDGTGKVVFKLKKPFEKNSFAIHYRWNHLKIPKSFHWPADFDNIYLCTDRYYDLYLTLNLSSSDWNRAAVYIDKKGMNAISKEWNHFLNEIDPKSKNVLSSESLTPKGTNLLFSSIKALFQETRHADQEPQISHTLFMPQDETKEHLTIDRLILYVPKTKTKHQYLFSNSIIRDCLQYPYPFFQAGMNCFALRVQSEYSLAQVSRLISEDEFGALYYVPEEYNQHLFPIYVQWSENDSSYYLSTRLNNSIVFDVIPQKQATADSLSYIVAEDSIFVFANRLIERTVSSGEMLIY